MNLARPHLFVRIQIFEFFRRTDSAPVGRMFPAGHYLCHLWPTRAVERYNGPWNHAPANPVVILGNKVRVSRLECQSSNDLFSLAQSIQ